MNKLASKWIFNKREDYLWIISPTLIGFFIIFMYFLLTDYLKINEATSVFSLYIIWAFLFDGTHAFATYSRTYFDKLFFKENKNMLLKSLSVFFIGPLFILTFYFLNDNPNATNISFIIFNRFAICYAYYHLIRQHWGFLVIYRKKNNEITDDITRKLDGLLLALGTIYPFLHGQVNKVKLFHISETIIISMKEWTHTATYLFFIGAAIYLLSFYNKLGLKRIKLNVIALLMIMSSVIVFLVKFYTLKTILVFTSYLVAVLFLFVLTYYLFLIVKTKEYQFNKPKWILLFTVLISYNIIFHLDIPILILIASITVFHNIQYHKIINFHNVNKYKSGDREKYGYAVILAQKIGVFTVLALLFNLVAYVPRMASNTIMDNLLLNYILSSFFWGFAFHHYYLDSIIWRIKNNPKLNNNLKI